MRNLAQVATLVVPCEGIEVTLVPYSKEFRLKEDLQTFAYSLENSCLACSGTKVSMCVRSQMVPKDFGVRTHIYTLTRLCADE